MKTLSVARPTERDKAVYEAAVELLFPSVWDWITATSEQENYPNDEREHVRQELLKAVGRSFAHDGYQLARALESGSMWEPDSELVDILDSYASFLHSAHRKAVVDWVIENSVIPQKKVGERVIIKVPGGEVDGVIIKVDESTAQYTVNVPSLGHMKYIFIEEDGELCAFIADGPSSGKTKMGGTHGFIKPVEEIDD